MAISRTLSSADGTPLRADYYPLATPSSPPAPGAGSAPAAQEEGNGHPGTGPSAQAPGMRGTVVILHGYCEHRGRYRHVAEHLNRHGYQVLCGDLRGHGESGGGRGFVRRFADYLEDVRALMTEAATLPSAPPAGRAKAAAKPVLLGHSMGGLVGLQFALTYPEALHALAISSPFLGLKMAVPQWKRTLGLVASVVSPTLRLPSGLSAADLSHDPEVGLAYDADPLVTHHATARWFTEAMAAQADLQARAGRLRVPTLMQVAGDDRIADAEVSRVMFDRLGAADKNLTVYPSLFHEIFNEVDRHRVLSDLTNWLAEH